MSRSARLALIYLALLVFTIFALPPIVQAINLAVGRAVIAATPLPSGLTNRSISAFRNSSFLHWSADAALIALAVAIVGVTLSSIVGFALARANLRPRSDAVSRASFPQLIPAVVLLLPLGFFLFVKGQIRASFWIGLIYLLTAAPFCCWQLKRAYDAISPAVEEAAAIDGCGRWRNFYAVLVPSVAPAFILTALFSFLVAWSDLFVVGSGSGLLFVWFAIAVFLAALAIAFCLFLFGRSNAVEV
ncbi:MAG TPA: ABC transporter permease subunit [Chthoniobacterales bacterium]|jgi:ABC-type maltose transport system permease subunit